MANLCPFFGTPRGGNIMGGRTRRVMTSWKNLPKMRPTDHIWQRINDMSPLHSPFLLHCLLLCGRANVVSGFSKHEKGIPNGGERVLRWRKRRSDISHFWRFFLRAHVVFPVRTQRKIERKFGKSTLTKRNSKVAYGKKNRIQ